MGRARPDQGQPGRVAPPPPVKNRVVVRRGVSNGQKEVSAVSAESNDKLSEMEWIDI